MKTEEVFRNTYVCTYMHAIINEKRDHEFERE